ncbi:MAG: Gfo/Idh/MocA family oxidoreductase [Actinomycetota bacterium]
MRVGVFGCGYWGSKHVRVLSGMPEVDLVVAVDPMLERTKALQRAFPGLLCVEDFEQALDFIDAAIVATPPRTHADLANRLMRAGKHVLVEKPMATDVDDAREMLRSAADNKVTLMAGHTFEYNAAVHRLRDIVAGGELGRIYYIDTARLNLGLYQSDVNVVWDLAPHDVSIINHVLGSEPTAVQAWGSRHAGSKFEDVAYMRLEYGHVGATANVHVSWLDPCKVRRVTVVGSERMAVYNDLADEERLRIYDKGVSMAEETNSPQLPMSYRYGGITLPHIVFKEPLAEQDAHFIASALSGGRPKTHGHNGLGVVKVLAAAEQSVRSGSLIEIENDDPIDLVSERTAEVGMTSGAMSS